MEWSWSTEAEQGPRAIGWFPGRSVDTSRWRNLFAGTLLMHEAAESFLREFGGLADTVARTPFDLDPCRTQGEDDRFGEWGKRIGPPLFPLGELDHGCFFLGIDEHSEIYLVETWVASCGRMPDAVGNLISSARPSRIA